MSVRPEIVTCWALWIWIASAPPPLITVLPVPYDPITIGAEEVPESDGERCKFPLKLAPAWKRMLSPGRKNSLFARSIVRHADVVDVPELESSPVGLR